MKIYKFKNKTVKGNDIQYWYDRSTRCWWIAAYSDANNQVGDAYHAYTKDELPFYANLLKNEH